MSQPWAGEHRVDVKENPMSAESKSTSCSLCSHCRAPDAALYPLAPCSALYLGCRIVGQDVSLELAHNVAHIAGQQEVGLQ